MKRRSNSISKVPQTKRTQRVKIDKNKHVKIIALDNDKRKTKSCSKIQTKTKVKTSKIEKILLIIDDLIALIRMLDYMSHCQYNHLNLFYDKYYHSAVSFNNSFIKFKSNPKKDMQQKKLLAKLENMKELSLFSKIHDDLVEDEYKGKYNCTDAEHVILPRVIRNLHSLES